MSKNSKFDNAVKARMVATKEPLRVAQLNVLRSFNTVVGPYDRVVGEGTPSHRVRLDLVNGGVEVALDGARLGVIPALTAGGRGYLRDGVHALSNGWSLHGKGKYEEAKRGSEGWPRVGGTLTIRSGRDRGYGLIEVSITFNPDGSPHGSGLTYGFAERSKERRRAEIDRLPPGHPERVAFLRRVTDKSARGIGFGISESPVPRAIDEVLAEMDSGEQPSTPVPDDAHSRVDLHHLADMHDLFSRSPRRQLPRPAEDDLPLGPPLPIKGKGRFFVGDAWWEGDAGYRHLVVKLCIGSGEARVPVGSPNLAGFVNVETDGSIRWGTKSLVPRADQGSGGHTSGGPAASQGEGRDFVITALEAVVPGIGALVRAGPPRSALTITLGTPAT